MQIRSITLGIEAGWPLPAATVEAGVAFLSRARQAFSDAGVGVQTTRLCTQPASSLVQPGDYPALAAALERAALEGGVDYCAAGALAVGSDWTENASIDAVVQALTTTGNFFSSLAVAQDGHVRPGGVRAAAGVIKRLSEETQQGFGNLRFAAVANMTPNGPFFPSAFHAGGASRYSLALQAADIARQAFSQPGTLRQAEQRLAGEMETRLRGLERIALELEAETGVSYQGVDLSPAPFPSQDASVAGALEDLGLERMGAPGSVFAAWRLTEALKQVPVRRCGFSGLMLPVLEDAVLADRGRDGTLSLLGLLACSAVCGTGLDTVPLPGATSTEELIGILLDVAALSCALAKPLTARLFPIPGKVAGELTEFTFPFFANAQVLATSGFGAAAIAGRAVADGG